MSKKREYPTPFQRSFFDQLEAVKASSMPDLIELARQQGIPRECAKAFWKTRHPRTAERPAAKTAPQGNLRKEPAA